MIISKEIRKIGILGAGVMAPQIAYLFLKHGFKVVLWDPYIHETATTYIKKRIEIDLSKNNITSKDGEIIISNFEASNNLSIVVDVDMVIEAVKENEGIKKKVYIDLGGLISREIIVATNTSSLSVNALAGYLDSPQRFIGMHYFNPVDIMRLIEIVPGDSTTQDVIDVVTALAEKLGKKFVLVKDCPGFIVNRLVIPLINEAATLLEKEIASAENIDKAMELGANHPLGPLALGDLIGLDICLAIMESLSNSGKYEISNLLKRLVREGNLGRKTKKGFFKY